MIYSKNLIRAVIAYGLLTVCSLTYAYDQSDRFINRNSEGWFWYVEPDEPIEPEEIIPEPVTQAEPVEQKKEETYPQGPAIFSAAWLRDNIPKYLDYALDDPTIENVEAYLYLQRYSMDRAEQFADVAEMAVTGNPMLDEMSRRPTATFGSQKVDIVAGQLRDKAITQLAQHAGVFFFYDPDDEYSQALAPLVKMLETSGFSIIAISNSGEPIPGHFNDFNYRADQGHAEQLGVSDVPSLFLADPNGNFAPIGQGLMSLPDMTHRMLVVAKREGWISEDEYNKTRPLTNSDNIAEIIATHPASPSGINSLLETAESENTNFVSPAQLVKFIKSKTQGNTQQELNK